MRVDCPSTRRTGARRRAASLLAALGLAAAASPALGVELDCSSFLGGRHVEGSGQLQKESRAASGFHAIAVGGAMTVVLRQGSREGVEVHADDNLLPLVETSVERGTLRIGTKKGVRYSSRNPVVVAVDLVRLDALTLGGSGHVAGPGLDADRLEVALGGSGRVQLPDLEAKALAISVGGSGDIELSGQSQRLEISVGGSGSVDAASLVADEVAVSVGGSGDANVHAKRTLDVSVAGSGDVVYRGDAIVKTSIAGSGTVKKR